MKNSAQATQLHLQSNEAKVKNKQKKNSLYVCYNKSPMIQASEY